MLGWTFFFQAEDGIRGLYVTGVQTCALPISFLQSLHPQSGEVTLPQGIAKLKLNEGFQYLDPQDTRSEERRVGKECRSRWLPYHLNKNETQFSVGTINNKNCRPPIYHRRSHL